MRFQGTDQLKHVRQPEGSELCFASLIASVGHLGEDSVPLTHQAAQAAQLSHEDGSTPAFMKEKSVNLPNGLVTLEPIVTPLLGQETVPEVEAAIDEAHEAGDAVMLLHKKTADTDNDSHHWVMLHGRFLEGATTMVRLLNDPLADELIPEAPERIADRIEQSLVFAGVYVYQVHSTVTPEQV